MQSFPCFMYFSIVRLPELHIVAKQAGLFHFIGARGSPCGLSYPWARWDGGLAKFKNCSGGVVIRPPAISVITSQQGKGGTSIQLQDQHTTTRLASNFNTCPQNMYNYVRKPLSQSWAHGPWPMGPWSMDPGPMGPMVHGPWPMGPRVHGPWPMDPDPWASAMVFQKQVKKTDPQIKHKNCDMAICIYLYIGYADSR